MNMVAIDSSIFFSLCCKLVIVQCNPTKGIVELVWEWKPIKRPIRTYTGAGVVQLVWPVVGGRAMTMIYAFLPVFMTQ